MLTKERLESIAFGSVRQSLDEGKWMARELLALHPSSAANQQVVNLAVENANLKNPANYYPASAEAEQVVASALDSGLTEAEALLLGVQALLDGIKTPATDAFLVNIQAQAVEKFAEDCDNDVVLVEPEDTEHYELMAEHAREFADKLRKGAAV